MASTLLKNSWIPTSPSICYQFVWELNASEETKGKLIVTDFIDIPNIRKEAIRLCAETNHDNDVIQLSCFVNNVGLSRQGYKMTAVTCSLDGQHCLLELKKVLGYRNFESSVLFRWDAMDGLPLETDWDAAFLTVRLYFSGSVEHYASCRVDINHGQELWNAAVGRQMTDVIFQVFDKTFAAHKFILAARSPVFRAMFDNDMVESRTGRVKIVDVEDPGIFQEFLHFLYTGQLVESMTQKLGTLAEKYQVETLASICREAKDSIAAFHEGLMLTVASDHELHEDLKRFSRYGQQDQPFYATLLYAEMFLVENALQYVDEGPRWIHDKAFLLKFESSSDDSATAVALYSSWANEPARKVSGVDLLVCFKDVVCKRAAMGPALTENDLKKQPLEVFTVRLCNAHVFHDPGMSCRFLIHRSSTVDKFEYGLRDSHLAQELWSSAVNKEWTDVEFRVGGKTFPAHQALLNARCPTLAKLIPSESSPLSPAIVHIGTTDPTTFEDLLYFLYTGLIRADSPDESLLEAAKSYHVETLELVGREIKSRNRVIGVNRDEISQAVFLLG